MRSIKFTRNMTWAHYAVFLYLLCGTSVASEEIKSVMEGQPVTLEINFTEVKRNYHQILWTFIYNTSETRIVQILRNNITVFDEAKRFRGRLNLDLQTGSLTINHINKSHAGLYEVQILNGQVKRKIFRVSVHAVLPEPVIIRDSSPCSSSRCLLWCSAVNVSDATLSWFIGSSEISSIHLNAENLNWSLPLAVEHEDGNIYSCVVNNSISISRSSDLCQCSDSRSRYYLLSPIIILVFILLLCPIVFIPCISRRKEHSQHLKKMYLPEQPELLNQKCLKDIT